MLFFVFDYCLVILVSYCYTKNVVDLFVTILKLFKNKDIFDQVFILIVLLF